MNNAGTMHVATPTDREIVVTRVVAARRIEIDAVGRLREIFALDGEGPHAVAHPGVEHLARVRGARRREHCLDDRAAATAVLDDSGPEVGESVRLCVRSHVGVDQHVVVVQVRDRASSVRVQPEWERADHERLEVIHEVATDEIG
jgi:hypothetical protein